MIGTIDIELSACKPNMPLQPVCAFVNSPQSIRIRNVPKSIGKWNISRVYVGVLYPDNTTINLDCVKEGGVYVCTFSGSTLAGTVKDGLTVYADGNDENNQTITGYVLGVGDIYILSSDGTVVHGGSTVHFYLEQPSNPVIGDMYNDNGVVKTYNGTEWIKQLNKTSDLVNDSGFTTQDDLDVKRDKTDLALYEPEWELQNVPEGIRIIYGPRRGESYWEMWTSDNVQWVALNVPVGSYPTNQWSFTWSESGEAPQYTPATKHNTQGDRLAKQSELPTKTSQLTNDSNFVTSADVPTKTSQLINDSFFITSASVPTKTSQLTNDSGFITSSDVPTKTSDLVNDSGFITSSDVPTVNNPTITLTQGGVTKGTFTLNQSTNKTIEFDGGDSGITVSWFYSTGGANSNQTVVIGDTTITYVSDNGVIVINGQQYAQLNKQISGVVKGETVPININCYGYGSDCVIIIKDEDGTTRYQQDVVKTLTKDTQIFISMSQCLESHTQILMADGTTKEIKNLSICDKVMSLNPDTMELEEDIVIDCDGGVKKLSYEKDVWTFSDGTTISTIHPHQFFNVRLCRMEYISNFQIGDEVLKSDGTKTSLVSHAVEEGTFFHNTLFTEKFNNYFANGVLSGNRHSKKFGWYWIQQNNQ